MTNNHFRVIVAGTRTFADYALLENKLDRLLSGKENVQIISGGAFGADALGEKYAKDRNLPLVVILADWNAFGRSAGPIRNRKMAEQADALVAFWDGRSKGTKNMIDTANKLGLQVRVVQVP